MTDDDPLPWAGPVAAVLSLGGILLATGLSPAFAWRAHALSNLGVEWTDPGTATTVVVFNGGLVAGGSVGLLFALALLGVGERVVAGSFTATLLALAAIGIFPQGTSLHLPVSIGFYLLVSITLWIDGVLAFGSGDHILSGTALLLGTANLGVWIVWMATGELTRPGIAVPEILGALLFAAWVCLRTLSLVDPGPELSRGRVA